MIQVSAKHVSKVLKGEVSALYGVSSQRCRLEWVTVSGGVLNSPHNINVGETKTLQVNEDVAGIWSPVMRDQRERVKFEDQVVMVDQLGFWYFANDLNLAGLQEILILQKFKDKYYTAAGTPASAVWTPTEAPSWSVDEWISYWLVFSDRRFKITSNTTTAITVDLTSGIPASKQSLPAGSNTGEIMGLVEWYPVRRDLGIEGGALSPLNAETIFQSVFVSRIPVTGR